MTRIFTYGTLKRGHPANRLLGDAAFLGEAVTASQYHIYRIGWYPGMVVNEDVEGGVAGELYSVSEGQLEDLDHYECVDSGLFVREEIMLSDGSRAFAYLFNGNEIVLEENSRIKDGVWR